MIWSAKVVVHKYIAIADENARLNPFFFTFMCTELGDRKKWCRELLKTFHRQP